MLRKTCGGLTSLCLLAPSLAGAVSNAERLHSFFSQAYEERLHDEPELATANGQHAYDDHWNDWSKAGRASWRAHL